MWSALGSIPEPQMAAGHKTLSVPPVRAVQLWPYILQHGTASAELYQSPSLTGLLTSMKCLYGIFKGISERFLALLLCISVFYAPSGRQIAHAQLTQTGSSVKLFPKGSMSTHTYA